MNQDFAQSTHSVQTKILRQRTTSRHASRATRFCYALLLTAPLLLLGGCKFLHGATDTLGLKLEISEVVGEQPLRLASATAPSSYKTAAGDEFSVTRLRYYLSNFRLRRADGSWYQAPVDAKSGAGYFLVDAADPASQTFEFMRAPAGDYSGIAFMLGVDDARNSAGVQTGTLDPARGMFWTWRTGYIFFSLEGASPQSTADQHALSFHVGGGGTVSLARTVFLPSGDTPLRVRANVEPLVHLHADVAALFHAVHEIRLAELNTVMEPAQGAELADNAASMFRIDHIHHEPRAAGHTQ
ncbi:MAG: hypothetical protein JWR16_1255 [Nevskia sp.]|nr:hypothetical protein [Nevskia sp.]